MSKPTIDLEKIKKSFEKKHNLKTSFFYAKGGKSGLIVKGDQLKLLMKLLKKA